MADRIFTEFKCCGYVESRIGGRAENQDSLGSKDTPSGLLVLVCDGMGGLQGGKLASSLAVKTILEDVSAADVSADSVEVVKKAISHANAVILEEGKRNSAYRNMGTTLTLLLLSEKSAITAHLGDSRIYQIRKGKKIFRTSDHSLVFDMVREGVLTEEQARVSSQSNIITKSLGISEVVEPDISVLPYRTGDRFVLCSDGFWGAMPEEEFLELVSGKQDLNDMLVYAADKVDHIGIAGGGGHDNLSAAVIDVSVSSSVKEKNGYLKNVILAGIVFLVLATVAAGCLLFDFPCGKSTDASYDACADSLKIYRNILHDINEYSYELKEQGNDKIDAMLIYEEIQEILGTSCLSTPQKH